MQDQRIAPPTRRTARRTRPGKARLLTGLRPDSYWK